MNLERFARTCKSGVTFVQGLEGLATVFNAECIESLGGGRPTPFRLIGGGK
jgi:hypothetical protein